MGCDNNFSVLAKPDPSLSQAEETLIFPPEKYQSSGSKLTDAGIYNFVVQDPVYVVQDPVHVVQDPVYVVLDPVYCVLEHVHVVQDPVHYCGDGGGSSGL